jgi:putative ABC transport system permease protein
VSWDSYQLVARHRDVAWTIPISLGDSHRGFRVLGTTASYFEHYRIAGGRPLLFANGQGFSELRDTVVGADVARELGYRIDESIVIAHGAVDADFARHVDHPFRVVGILARTGTPVDHTVHISLEAMTDIHAAAGSAGAHAQEDHRDLTPQSITAFMVGLRDRAALLTMQRALNDYRKEPLQAIIPGVALKQLWDLIGIADRALMVVASFVVLAGLLGMLTAILVSLNERRREMAVLRSVGAGPRDVFSLLMLEAGALSAAGVLAGLALCYALLALAQPLLAAHYGIFVPLSGPNLTDIALLGGIVLAALVMALFPAWRAYRNTLSDGLTIRV